MIEINNFTDKEEKNSSIDIHEYSGAPRAIIPDFQGH